MMTLYVQTGCPFCVMVVHKLDELGVPYEERNIVEAKYADELVARGGKRQVPYLVDPDGGAEMYESADIMKYLDTQYQPV